MSLKTLFSFMVFCMAFACQSFAITISDVRLSAFNSGTSRLVLESDKKIDPSVFTLNNPNRLVLDIPNTSVAQSVKKRTLKGNKLISNVRYGTQKGSVSRIVLDLTSPVSESHFILPPQKSKNPWRFVLDATPNKNAKLIPAPVKTSTSTASKNTSNTSKTLSNSKKSALNASISATKATAAASANAKAKTSSSTSSLLPFSSKKGKKIVMLDAGHGGQDPGAISKSGHYEKDLTLKMVKETKPLLEKAGYKVVLTRDGDYFVTLRGRVKKAHDANADLFISIHADSTKNTSAKGLSIYTISETASDKEAAALAERENKADILLGMDLGDYQQEVSSVLIDLAKQETMKESRRYADLVVKEMRQTVRLVPNAHRFAGFAVLKSPNIPSVLLEMGYLSNVGEEKQLQTYSYRQKLSKALVRAVNAYFKELDD